MHLKTIQFTNYKAFKRFSLTINDFNVLVGQNNSGKSTILSSFRILFEAIRKANSKSSEIIQGPEGDTYGYRIKLDPIPIATENIFTDYDESEPAQVAFIFAKEKKLLLYFRDVGECLLIPISPGKPIRTPSNFKSEFPFKIGYVPILGPVENNEKLVLIESAREALLSHGASRNFRNIWHHYPANFDRFHDWIAQTWPGMDILKPVIQRDGTKARLLMYCKENRIDREIYWSGFGFQVWCQMLTAIANNEDASILIIDEPDIYLHSDLQRQLAHILKDLNLDVILATHSTEIISEVDPDSLVIINKKARSGKRLRSIDQLPKVFQELGSSLNPSITQITKTKRVLFVEGLDFKILANIARKNKFYEVATKKNFAVIPVEGFNPQKVIHMIEGIQSAIGEPITSGVVFDRDYRHTKEIDAVKILLQPHAKFIHIHNRKEIENFLLVPDAIERAIRKKLAEKDKRNGSATTRFPGIISEMDSILSSMKTRIQSQYLAKWPTYIRSDNPGLDASTVNMTILNQFEDLWTGNRYHICHGKDVLAALNTHLQENYSTSITAYEIISEIGESEFDSSITDLLGEIERL